jgi:penicillin V acylase-like amidase (Ntn superfamily)
MTAAVAALTSAFALPVSSLACTTFCLLSEDRIILGKNYDWHIATGLLFVNKRGVERSGQPPRDRGKDWVSKFGSVTFNQYGRDLPAGGMNEVGLVVEVMWMNGTVFPEPDHRPAVTGTSWVQYQLDTSRSVSDVVASNAEVRISRSAAPLHYLVAERSGDVAVIEFRDGEQVVYRGTTLPVPALANDFYADALKL